MVALLGITAGIGLYWGNNHPWNISNTLILGDAQAVTKNI